MPEEFQFTSLETNAPFNVLRDNILFCSITGRSRRANKWKNELLALRTRKEREDGNPTTTLKAP